MTFGIDAYTAEVVLEESEQQPGCYRLVHPYKKLCEEIIPAAPGLYIVTAGSKTAKVVVR